MAPALDHQLLSRPYCDRTFAPHLWSTTVVKVRRGRMHADHNAAINIAARCGDREIQTTKTRQELKALVEARHQQWRVETGWS